jgi:hypothetical protein
MTGDSEADYWDWTQEFMAPPAVSGPACHFFHETCGCVFCAYFLATVADVWDVLSALEVDAMHRTVVPGRHVER